MPDNKPYLLFVFSNPGGDRAAVELASGTEVAKNADDLRAIKQEINRIQEMLILKKDRDRAIDYGFFDNRSLDDIISQTIAFSGYNAHLFHFSGHANEKALLFPEGLKKGAPVCTLLKHARTSIVFLNGCCTKGLLEDIFSGQNEVKAVIASYTKIEDKKAAEFSTKFYDFFVAKGNNLRNSFDLLASSSDYDGSMLHKQGCEMRGIGLDDNLFPDENKPGFQWGLFYRDPSVLSCTLDSLIDGSTREHQENKKKDLEDKLDKLRERFQRLQLPETDEYCVELTKNIQATKLELEGLCASIESRLREQQHQIAEAEAKQLRNRFTESIKKINYTDQQNVYLDCLENQFIALAATGDPEALMELLLLKFREEFKLSDNLYVPFTIDYTSNIAGNFWDALALQLEPDTRQMLTTDQIIHVLLGKIFFGGNKPVSQVNILLKLRINQLSASRIAKMHEEFWTAFYSGLKKDFNNSTINHRIVMLLTDEDTSKAEAEEFERFIESTNQQIETPLKIIPFVDPLTSKNILNWILTERLHTVGIDKDMVEEIFNRSEGKIRRVLSVIKEKSTMNDLPLFGELNVL